MTTASITLHAVCAALCMVCAILVLAAGRGRRAFPAAATVLVFAFWAVSVALRPEAPLDGLAGALEVARAIASTALLIHLCRGMAGAAAQPLLWRFGLTAALLAGLALVATLPGQPGALILPALGSPGLLARLGLALLIVLLAENLWRNAGEAIGWHVNLPCIALGGLATFDVVLYADAVMFSRFSLALFDARAALTALAALLLVLAAVRDRRWRPQQHRVSRDVVFHGATLLVAGTFLVLVGAAGEALRRFGDDWGPTAQASLLAAALMALAVALATRSVRSRLRRMVVDHFFAARYDYRREWLRCVTALSAQDNEAPVRAIRAIADAVDSPAGLLLLRDAEAEGPAAATPLRWHGSWNLPAEPLSLPPGHALAAALGAQRPVLGQGGSAMAELEQAYGPLWLAVPLLHHREGLLGAVLLARPRAPFPLDAEVLELVLVLGREVALFIAERQAAQRLADGRHLAAYAQRFAFVAHDVKTVSSQLSLLLANAKDNLQDPEFQQDMLLTVHAAATRIDTLIARLRQGDAEAPGASPEASSGVPPAEAPPEAEGVQPLARLRLLVRGRGWRAQVEDAGGGGARTTLPGERFDAVVSHLMDNAAEASPAGEPVRVVVRHEAGRLLVEIIDRGAGMSAAFIRDELFRPLHTTKPRGNGIGAWQARELLRGAGGELEVRSQPGQGTTMRLILPAPAGRDERMRA